MKHYDTEENNVRIIFYFITNDLRKLAYRYDIVNDEGRLYTMGDYKYTRDEFSKIGKMLYNKILEVRQKYLKEKK